MSIKLPNTLRWNDIVCLLKAYSLANRTVSPQGFDGTRTESYWRSVGEHERGFLLKLPKSTLRWNENCIFSKAALGKLLRDGVERIIMDLPERIDQSVNMKLPKHLERERELNCFKGNIGETPERRGGAHMDLPERIDQSVNMKLPNTP